MSMQRTKKLVPRRVKTKQNYTEISKFSLKGFRPLAKLTHVVTPSIHSV